jgi:anti-sigma-K factor RskA
VNGQEHDHAVFDELAAGHVLHALDPEDEQRFLRHAGDCPICPETLAAFSDVAAALAETTPAAEPSPELGARITAETRRGKVIPLTRRPVPRWLRPAAAAAAAAVVIGGGIWAGLAATATHPLPPSSCAHQRGCAEVPVISSATHQPAARVIVLNGSVYLTPTRMPANHRTDQIYVLWQIPKGHAPLAVGSFDVHTGPNAAIKIGRLAAPYDRTAAFAISLEPGRMIPPAPTKVVAVGPIT